MLLSETTMRRVFTTTTASTVGQIEDLIVDPRSRTIVALRLFGARNGDILHWTDITAVGPDAITVASTEAVRDAEGRTAELLAGDYQIMGKRLIAETGEDIGRVLDVDFDPRTGSIRALVTTGGRIDGDRLLTCGSYAAVVRTANGFTVDDVRRSPEPVDSLPDRPNSTRPRRSWSGPRLPDPGAG